MKIPTWGCAEFETALSDYRDGTLRLELAAAARQHLSDCRACADLLAGVAEAVSLVRALPSQEPSPRLLAAIRAATARRESPRTRLLAAWGRVWSGVSSPRFALAVAMSVFTVSLLLNAAQVNLRQVSIASLSPDHIGSSLQRQVERTWARGVSYYHDLRVVYEIEAAVRQMRQDTTPPPAQPAGRDHSQAAPAGAPELLLAAAFLAVPGTCLSLRRSQ